MNEEKFISAANQYKDTIYRVAFNYFRNSFDAEDAVQEVLMKLYTSKKEFETNEYIRYWIIRVTINHCKNVLRTPWRRKRGSLEEVMSYNMFDSHRENELLADVMLLAQKYRVTLYLFYYEEYSVKEIAELMNVKESVVTTRLSRAREQLRVKLKEEQIYE